MNDGKSDGKSDIFWGRESSKTRLGGKNNDFVGGNVEIWVTFEIGIGELN